MVNSLSILADQPGSQAVVAVNGRGVGGPSRWSTNRQVTLAKYGSGELHVTNEGYVEHDAIVIVAEQTGSNATINVDGPGSEYRPKFLTLSGAGTSVLNVTNGGAVVSEEVFSATELEGTATINVDGAVRASSWMRSISMT